jgi:fructosamine-3-kinase
MTTALKEHIEYLLCVKFTAIKPVSGGDISEAFVLQTESEHFFCKINARENAYDMFISEKEGLEAIGASKTIAVPKVLLCERLERGALLLLEYLPSKSATPTDMALLGHQLAALHQFTDSDGFGWKSDNFIGNLHQSNKWCSTWPEFYVQQRLLPQLKLAQKKNLLAEKELPSQEHLEQACRNLFPKVSPCLLHGDLWGGNYLIATNDIPYLIDPAVYYGHYEVDIAMTKLFGGFDRSFYDAYGEHFPRIGGENERLEWYQLYYLLVHLNLCGRSYHSSVVRIIKKYF